MKTILVIDDEECIRGLVQSVLESRDCRVLLAGDGGTGLDLAVREHPDLVVMDCRMPGLSGAEALRRLRADGRIAAIPVILMSGARDDGFEEAGRSSQADGYLLKPFRPVQLLQEIQSVLKAPPLAKAAAA